MIKKINNDYAYTVNDRGYSVIENGQHKYLVTKSQALDYKYLHESDTNMTVTIYVLKESEREY